HFEGKSLFPVLPTRFPIYIFDTCKARQTSACIILALFLQSPYDHSNCTIALNLYLAQFESPVFSGQRFWTGNGIHQSSTFQRCYFSCILALYARKIFENASNPESDRFAA